MYNIDYYEQLLAGMKVLRSNFENIWIDIDKYVLGFVGSYDSNPLKGQITFEDVYDQTAMNANIDATNALVGILWQQGGRSIKITPSEELMDNTEASEWFEQQTKRFVRVLDDPNAGLVSTLIQYMGGALSHGSGGVGVFRSSVSQLVFKPYAVRVTYYQENDEGMVDTVAIRTFNPAYKVVQKYGEENVAENVLKMAKSPTERNTDVEIVQFIFPNKEEDKDEQPFKSVHVDLSNKVIVKDSFYEQQQIFIGRIYKNSFETYGRSPAINNLVNIKRLNAVAGDTMEGVELTIRPPKGIMNDSMVGNTVIDLSANAVNMFNTQATEGNLPLFPLNTVGDLNPAFLLAEQLRTAITEGYHINKLIDLNNDANLTATEALILDRIRNTSLGALMANQINGVFTPIIEASFNILFNDGYFGYIQGSEQARIEETRRALEGDQTPMEYIPESIAAAYSEGKDIYRVEYLTPAARMLASEEANNIVEASQVVAGMSNVFGQEALDNVDVDESVRSFYKLKGLEDQLTNEEDVQERRTVRTQQLQRQQSLNQAQQATQVQEAQDAG